MLLIVKSDKSHVGDGGKENIHVKGKWSIAFWEMDISYQTISS